MGHLVLDMMRRLPLHLLMAYDNETFHFLPDFTFFALDTSDTCLKLLVFASGCFNSTLVTLVGAVKAFTENVTVSYMKSKG